MLPPWTLLDGGVQVCRAVQEPGQYIVTLPRAYHSGFSHGFNTAEAVNFMLHDWLPYGAAAAERYKLLAKEPVIDVDAILVRASDADHSPQVHSELAQRVAHELAQRDAARAAGCRHFEMSHADRCADLGRSPACQVCGHICHFGFVQMGTERVRGAPPSATPSDAKIRKGGTQKASALLAPDEPKLVCLDHFAQLDAPPAAKGGAGGRCLFSRYDDEQLVAMATRASQRAAVHMQGEGKARTRPTLPGPSPCAARLPGAVERALKELRAKRGAKASKK